MPAPHSAMVTLDVPCGGCLPFSPCGGGRTTMTPLPSLLHTPTWRPNAASTPAQPAFSSTALPLALEPWPLDSETLAFHWTHRPPTSTGQNYQLCSAVGTDEFWVRSDLLALSSFRSHPVLQAAFRLRVPSACNAHTKVVSTAS